MQYKARPSIREALIKSASPLALSLIHDSRF